VRSQFLRIPPNVAGGCLLRGKGVIKMRLDVTRLADDGKPFSGAVERLKTFASRATSGLRALSRAEPVALAMGMIVAGLTISPGPAAGQSYDPAAVTSALCRGYAAAQHALPYDTMYAQCMYARGYVVPGFSPSPNSPGYQGELPGPGAIGGGH
jgi:hypothetical protein